jgi:hypothetical protein
MNHAKNRFCRLSVSLLFGVVPLFGSVVWAQNVPQPIAGRVTAEIGETLEPLSGVDVYMMINGITQKTKTNSNGQFAFRASAPMGLINLLYNKAGYKTCIKQLEQIKREQFDAVLESSFYTPENINLFGYVSREGQGEAKIGGATVYAHNGVYRVQTDPSGFFQLSISLETSGSDTSYLWIEAEKYQTKIVPLTDLRDRNPAESLSFELVPSTTVFQYSFQVKRKDTNENSRGVEVRINNIAVGKTDENGLISTQFEPGAGENAENVVDFLHPQLRPSQKKYSISQLAVKDLIFLEPPTFNIEPLVYYQAEDGARHFVTDTRYFLRGKEIPLRQTQAGPRLTFQALFGEKLKAEIAFAAVDSVIKKEFSLPRDTAAAFNWLVSKPVVKARIQLDSLSSRDHGNENVALYLLRGEQLFKADRNGEVYEVISNRLDPPKSRSDWQVLVVSLRYEMIAQLDKDGWRLDQDGNYTVRIHLRERSSISPSPEIMPDLKPEKPAGFGVIKVETAPPAAEIRVEELTDFPVKHSPDSLKLPVGRYTLSIKKGGYVPQYRVVEVEKDSTRAFRINLGEPFTPLSRRTNIKVVAEAGAMGWFLHYPKQKDGAFPTLRAGGYLLYRFSPDFGVKFSYFASKVPGYYIEQVFAVGMFAGAKRLHGAVELRENTFEATKEVKAKFDGRSLQTNLWLCLGKRNEAAERLPFLEQYRWAMQLGYETSFRSINRTVPRPLPREQELSTGFLLRVGRGILDARYGYILEDVALIKQNTGIRSDARIGRVLVRYLYFLN